MHGGAMEEMLRSISRSVSVTASVSQRQCSRVSIAEFLESVAGVILKLYVKRGCVSVVASASKRKRRWESARGNNRGNTSQRQRSSVSVVTANAAAPRFSFVTGHLIHHQRHSVSVDCGGRVHGGAMEKMLRSISVAASVPQRQCHL